MKEKELPKVALLAGGLATRLRPITETIPKSMIDIAGKPFIDHQLCLLKNKGFKSIVICCGYLSEQIINYVGDGSRFGLTVKYSLDGDKLLGTGGGVKKALTLLDEEFFIIYGDSYVDVDFKSIWQSYITFKKNGLMVVIKNNNKWDKSNIKFRDGNIIAYDKINPTNDMEYIDYGISIAKKDTFLKVPENIFDLSKIHQNLILNHNLLGYEVFNRFYEIGSLQGIKELEQFINNK